MKHSQFCVCGDTNRIAEEESVLDGSTILTGLHVMHCPYEDLRVNQPVQEESHLLEDFYF